MITPRCTRLVRVPELHAFRHSIARLVAERADCVSSTAVLVPSREAAAELRLTLGGLLAGEPQAGEVVTRDELYASMNARLPAPRRQLTAYEREVLLRVSAHHAIASGAAPPFQLRPGLVAEMLRFYDQLRRHGQSIDRFEQLLVDRLSGETDRGADRVLRQTRFLAASFREYERLVRSTGAVDEHVLRDHLLQIAPDRPLRHLIVCVADWIADPNGLASADFDLLARVPDLAFIDLIATDRLLRSGFHERVHGLLPGIEEVDGDAMLQPPLPLPLPSPSPSPSLSPSPKPCVLASPDATDRPVFVVRDREEELVAFVRRLAADPRFVADLTDPEVAAEPQNLRRTGIAFVKPLPYLYLAAEVFGAARIPYWSAEGLPLAAEPAAAALDLLVEFVSSHFCRDATIALLRSAQFRFEVDGSPITRRAVTALDRALREARYLGELAALRALEPAVANSDAAAALRLAIELGERAEALLTARPAAEQLTAIAAFLTSFANSERVTEREARSRAAVLAVLQSLAMAHAAHDARGATLDELVPEIRRWIEDEVFPPTPADDRSVRLLHAQAARFADLDDLTLVGLVEGEWPERPRRNIFYSSSLLNVLGWPSEQDRRAAASAAFLDLVRSPSRSIAISTFTLDDDALVEPATLLDELSEAGLSRREPAAVEQRVFVDEALSLEPLDLEALDEDAREWARLRVARTDRTDPRYRGLAGPQTPRPLSVSAIETYLTCPFKFFAQNVLRLEEEPDDQDVMDPKKQGRFVHQVFQSFFQTWTARGHGSISAETLGLAREIFQEIVEVHAARLPDAEASLERTRLLGSSVAVGLGEVVFRMEAERPGVVVDRLLEHRLDGDFEFAGPAGTRRIALRGVADRVDLLEDGTMRLIDYKLSSPPPKSRALQLPIYGLCAEQQLAGRHGRRWVLGEAAYVAFRGKAVTPLFTARSGRDQVLAAAQEKLIAVVDRIERGEFPPTPADVFLCGFCSYSAVCRKDYVDVT